jgi:cell division protein ZapA (FtsZ GTPase activity inhibitor)
VRSVRRSAPEEVVKKAVTLDIAGASYRMMVDADEAHLERLAALVNERFAALGPKAQQKASPAQLLAMVALSLADELVTVQGRCQAIEDTTRRAVTNAIARIDRRLSTDMGPLVDA